MNFVLWMVKRAWKRAWKRANKHWHRPGTKDEYSGKIDIAIVTLAFLMIVAVCSDVTFGKMVATVTMFLIWMLGFAVLTAYESRSYLEKLHAQYRTEQPEQEKPKRKRKNDDTWVVKHTIEDGYWEERKIHNIHDYFEEGEANDQR